MDCDDARPISGNGTFAVGQDLSNTANGAHSVFLADLNGDEAVDVLTAAYLGDSITWYENEGGAFSLGVDIYTEVRSSTWVFLELACLGNCSVSPGTPRLGARGEVTVFFSELGSSLRTPSLLPLFSRQTVQRNVVYRWGGINGFACVVAPAYTTCFLVSRTTMGGWRSIRFAESR